MPLCGMSAPRLPCQPMQGRYSPVLFLAAAFLGAAFGAVLVAATFLVAAFLAGAFFSAGAFLAGAFFSAGAFLAVAFFAPDFFLPDASARAAKSGRASSSVTVSGEIDFGSVALTDPCFT